MRNSKTKQNYLNMIQERIDNAMPMGIGSCISFAEYVTGETSSEEVASVQNNHIRGYNGIGGMPMTNNPEEGCIVAWNKNGINYHAAVVQKIIGNDILIAQRDDRKGMKQEYIPIKDISYDKRNLSKAFYIPHALEKIINGGRN